MNSLRTAIHERFINKIVNISSEKEDSIGVLKKHVSISPSVITAAFFPKRFGYWIEQRKKS